MELTSWIATDWPCCRAHYAGKQSQLTIGLMYLNGNGVEKDPATACAWLALAAARGQQQESETETPAANGGEE